LEFSLFFHGRRHLGFLIGNQSTRILLSSEPFSCMMNTVELFFRLHVCQRLDAVKYPFRQKWHLVANPYINCKVFKIWRALAKMALHFIVITWHLVLHLYAFSRPTKEYVF